MGSTKVMDNTLTNIDSNGDVLTFICTAKSGKQTAKIEFTLNLIPDGTKDDSPVMYSGYVSKWTVSNKCVVTVVLDVDFYSIQ